MKSKWNGEIYMYFLSVSLTQTYIQLVNKNQSQSIYYIKTLIIRVLLRHRQQRNVQESSMELSNPCVCYLANRTSLLFGCLTWRQTQHFCEITVSTSLDGRAPGCTIKFCDCKRTRQVVQWGLWNVILCLSITRQMLVTMVCNFPVKSLSRESQYLYSIRSRHGH